MELFLDCDSRELICLGKNHSCFESRCFHQCTSNERSIGRLAVRSPKVNLKLRLRKVIAASFRVQFAKNAIVRIIKSRVYTFLAAAESSAKLIVHRKFREITQYPISDIQGIARLIISRESSAN